MQTNQQHQHDNQYREPLNNANGAGENVGAPAPDPEGKLALNPNITHNEIVPADSLPSDKKVTSDIVGAEAEDGIGTAAAGAGFVGGTGGSSNASEGRVGNSDNYGANQFGPGLATGPMSNNLSNGTAD